MAQIAPFKGLGYNQTVITDMAQVVTPPYDVISPEQQDQYYLAHPNNVIRLILNKVRPDDNEMRNGHVRAATHFKDWWAGNILVRDREPAIYLYRIDYPMAGVDGRLTRKGFISLVRLDDYSQGTVLPHEKTFSATKAERLGLISKVKANFSQIFTLYDDAQLQAISLLEAGAPAEPQLSFTDHGGTIHTLWAVTDPETIARVRACLAGTTFYIADGHHRYETGLAYRDYMRAKHPQAPAGAAFNYTMIYATAMQDPGLTILPAHRLVKDLPGFKRDDFLARAAKFFDITELPFERLDPAPARSDFCYRMAADGWEKNLIGFHLFGEDRLRILTLKEGVMADLDIEDCFKDLDVVVLSEIIYDKCLGISQADADNPERFVYDADMNSALDRITMGGVEMGFLLNPTRIEQLQTVSQAGQVMPRKSTYFYPKVWTGLVFNPIVPSEVVLNSDQL